MALFDKPRRVRVHVFLDQEHRAEIEHIANQQGATVSAVHREALARGLPQLRRALLRETTRAGSAVLYPTVDQHEQAAP